MERIAKTDNDDSPTRKLTVTIPDELQRRVKAQAAMEAASLNAFVERVLREYVSKHAQAA